MTLEPNHSVVWKGNLCSDIVFTTAGAQIPPNIFDLKVFLELKSKVSATKDMLVPSNAVTFSGGRPNFHFHSTKEQFIANKSNRQHLFSANSIMSIGARVHHDVLEGNFDSFRLILAIVTRTKPSKASSSDLCKDDLSEGMQDKINALRRQINYSSIEQFSRGDVKVLMSKSVCISEYKLSIQEQFSNSEHVMKRKDISPDVFEWYNKNGGDMVSIEVIIHLKDSDGAIVYDYPEPLQIKTELVYEDGRPTPFFTQNSVKNKTNSKGKNNAMSKKSMKLFKPTRPEPVLGQGVGSQHFSFRIEEVSAHHPKHGFKLKATPYSDTARVFYGVMEETIIVKSKPKTSCSNKRGKGGRRSILQEQERHRRKTNVELRSLRKVSLGDLTESSRYDKPSNTIKMKLSSINTIFTGINGSTCIGCGEKLKQGCGLCPSHHKPDCRFNLTLVPFTFSVPEANLSLVEDTAKNYQCEIANLTPDETESDDFGSHDAAESLLALSGTSV